MSIVYEVLHPQSRESGRSHMRVERQLQLYPSGKTESGRGSLSENAFDPRKGQADRGRHRHLYTPCIWVRERAAGLRLAKEYGIRLEGVQIALAGGNKLQREFVGQGITMSRAPAYLQPVYTWLVCGYQCILKLNVYTVSSSQ